METIDNIYGVWRLEFSDYGPQLHLHPSQHGLKLLKDAEINLRGQSIIFPFYTLKEQKSLMDAVRHTVYYLKNRAREAHV